MTAMTADTFTTRADLSVASPSIAIDLTGLGGRGASGPVRRMALFLVWLAIASASIVFSEPAPADALNLALIVLLPVVGLVAVKREITVMLALWLVVAAGGFVASGMGHDIATATKETAISLYLYIAAFVMAGFVAKDPGRHVKLMLEAYLAGAVLASLLALAGYFDLPSGAAEIFTRHSRATGGFKDPNVLGAFLVPAIVYAFHTWLQRPPLAGLPRLGMTGLFAFALLLSFSRGAWFAAAAALLIYGWLMFVTARRNSERLRLVGIGCIGALGLAGVVAVGMGFDKVDGLFEQRASLTQSYDVGPEGRFGGQRKALDILTERPLGIGALEFNVAYHHEDPHNSYLTMFLNTGWVGGLTYLIIMASTLAFGFRYALRRTRSQPLFIVVYAAVAATLLEAAIIDVDHWRHLHLMLAMAWGMMAADKRIVREPRIVKDRRNVLLQSLIVLPPSRRQARIMRALARPYRDRSDEMWNRPARIVADRSRRSGRQAHIVPVSRTLN